MRKTASIAPSRKRRERWLQFLSGAAVWLTLAVLVGLFAVISQKGGGVFAETRIVLDIQFGERVVAGESGRRVLRQALYDTLNITAKADKRLAGGSFLSRGATADLAEFIKSNRPTVGSNHAVAVRAKGIVDDVVKGRVNLASAGSLKIFSTQQRAWLAALQEQGRIKYVFNRTLFTAGDSTEAETAGIGIALIGSAIMLLIVVILAVPIGVAAALYMEFFAPKTLFVSWIDASIKNLAAVPSIVFGILGLALFINFLQLPRSAPLVGGIVLALMTLPTIIITARSALGAVPPSLLEASLAMGSSKMQGLFHHVLPSAAAGITTSVIIGLAQALGETAPLLMIGMVAFIADYPSTVADPSSALPVQVYIWASMAERGFAARAAAAIMVLLAFLISTNAFAVWLRQRMEKRW